MTPTGIHHWYDDVQFVKECNDRVAESESLLRCAVDTARENGAPWNAIGHVLGTSRQAAQQRFG
jgi:hypothetical protein